MSRSFVAKRLSTPSRWLAGLLLSSTLATGANAGVVDFQVGTAGSCYAVHCVAQGYSFDFIAGGWAVTNDNNSFFNYNASGGIAGAKFAGNGAPPIVITMGQLGGGGFDLATFDAATGEANFGGASTIDLLGTFVGGGTVTQSISVTHDWASYALSGFTNLVSLKFSNRDAVAGISIDNLNSTAATAVPEPETYALMGLGLAALGLMRRRATR